MEPFHRSVTSYVTRGNRLDAKKQRAWDAYAKDWLIEHPPVDFSTSVDPSFRVDPVAAFGRKAPMLVEIGSGSGDSAAQAALDRPHWNILALEVYRPGVAQMFGRVGAQGSTNVRAILADAVPLFTFALPQVDEVWTFFPDPWHKNRHHKRRLISTEFGNLVASRLKPGGLWRIATDWEDYAAHVRESLDSHPDFAWAPEMTEKGAPRYEGRPLTRFEKRAVQDGRPVTDLVYVRR